MNWKTIGARGQRSRQSRPESAATRTRDRREKVIPMLAPPSSRPYRGRPVRRLLLAPVLFVMLGLLLTSTQSALAAPPPAVTGLSPNSGPTGGGTTVMLTGTDFTGTTSVMFGATGAAFITNSGTSITATTPAGVPGTVNVRVTTADGTSAIAAGNQYTYLGTLPQVTALNPASGPVNGGNSVILTGSGFTGATSVMFGGVGASFIVGSDFQISTTAPAALGPSAVNVRVTTANGTSPVSLTNQYAYVTSGPVVTSLTPASGPVSGGTTVYLTGSGFTNAFAVTFSQVGVPFTINSDTQITAVSPPANGAGNVYVRVSTPSGTSGASAGSLFTYTGFVNSVTVSSLSPTSGPASGGTSVSIYGSGFSGATSVTFGGVAANFTVANDNLITAISPPGSGSVYVRVTAGGLTSVSSSSNLFTYTGVSSQVPYVTGVSPNSGPPSGGTVITVTGYGFTGTTAVLFAATPAASFTVNSDTQLTVISPPYSAGAVGIGVYTPAGVSPNTAADDFSYVGFVPPTPPSPPTTPGPYFCPSIPLWTNDLAYGSPGGGFYWDPVSGLVWTGQRGWHLFAPQPFRRFPQPLWVNALGYGSAGGGFYWDPISGQVWTAERGWHLYGPQGCIR